MKSFRRGPPKSKLADTTILDLCTSGGCRDGLSFCARNMMKLHEMCMVVWCSHSGQPRHLLVGRWWWWLGFVHNKALVPRRPSTSRQALAILPAKAYNQRINAIDCLGTYWRSLKESMPFISYYILIPSALGAVMVDPRGHRTKGDRA